MVSTSVFGDVGRGADLNRIDHEKIQKESRETGNKGESTRGDRDSRPVDQPSDRSQSKPSLADARRADEARVKEQLSKNAGKTKEFVDAKRADEARVKEMTSKSLADAKRADEKRVKEVAAANEERRRIADVVKPPFTDTPMVQPLNAKLQQSDSAKATPTANSPKGGYPGPFRSGGKKSHYGLDELTTNPRKDVAYYTGTVKGTVIAVRDSKQYGKSVTIQLNTKDGHVWASKTMHHRELLVKVGQEVGPGQAIAVGGGAGSQFKSKEAGKPHVHWEVTRDGKTVNPLSGEIIRDAKDKSAGSRSTRSAK
jgi:murein DD-endopeptidase MepM/ murein hydrolase activator NlpD